MKISWRKEGEGLWREPPLGFPAPDFGLLEAVVSSELSMYWGDLLIGHLTPALCIRIMALAGWLSPLWDESLTETFLHAFSKGQSVASWRLLHREVYAQGNSSPKLLAAIHWHSKCFTHCGFFLSNCHSGFQQSARCSYCSTVVLLCLNPLLIASCSKSLRADYPSLSASAPLLLHFFVFSHDLRKITKKSQMRLFCFHPVYSFF